MVLIAKGKIIQLVKYLIMEVLSQVLQVGYEVSKNIDKDLHSFYWSLRSLN